MLALTSAGLPCSDVSDFYSNSTITNFTVKLNLDPLVITEPSPRLLPRLLYLGIFPGNIASIIATKTKKSQCSPVMHHE